MTIEDTVEAPVALHSIHPFDGEDMTGRAMFFIGGVPRSRNFSGSRFDTKSRTAQ